MNRDLALANYLAHSGNLVESKTIYIICNVCQNDRFNIHDSFRVYGGRGITRHSVFIAECDMCGTIYDVNICKMRVQE